MRSDQDVIARTKSPVTRGQIVSDLVGLGVRPGDLILVHSSLRSLGWVVGGEVTVIEALQEAVGPEGTLLMPAHTPDNTDPSRWSHPPIPESWWSIVRDNMPAFHPDKTPAHRMGAIAECFRSFPNVRRSRHPIGSFAALGLCADEMTAEHDPSDMFGERSPLGAVYRAQGKVLLLGVGHDSNTSLHLAETRANWPGKVEIEEGFRIETDHGSQWQTTTMIEWNDDDFPTIGAAFEQMHPCRISRVGQADARLMDQVALVDFAVQWMNENRS